MLTDEKLTELFRYSFGLIDSRMTPNQQAFCRLIESAACAERDARIAELTRELEEARKALETARIWIAERPDMRQCSAGKIVAELTRALSVDAAIKEQT